MHREKISRGLLAGVLTLVLSLQPAQGVQDVANTVHNLSVTGPGTIKSPGAVDEICVFCHTPHNSLPVTPLWNHSLSSIGTTYLPYESTTLAAIPGQPTGKSVLCLACHDGTVALGNLQNSPDANDMGGIFLVSTDRAYLGTDLRDDHPISFVYDGALQATNAELANPATIDLPLDGNELQCTSCHDPHEKDVVPFLHKTSLNGELCTTCHVRGGVTWTWSTSSHATSPATPLAGNPWSERKIAWRGANVAQNACFNCHRPHTAPTPQRLIKGIEENTCYLCHNGSVATTNIQAELQKVSGHPVASLTPNPSHDAATVENPLTMPLHVECADCHNPHAVAAAPPMISFNPSAPTTAPHATPPLANARIAGVSGLDVNGSFKAEVDFQYELCFKCHGVPGRSACGSDRCPTATGFSMVRLDGVYNIRDKVYSGTPGIVSYHPLVSNDPSNNTEVPSLRADIPMNRISSLMYCTDCHNNNQSAAAGGTGPNGPHGSLNEALLTQNYSFNPTVAFGTNQYQLCFKCHSQANILSDASFREHRLHVEQSDKACINCHDPHGSHRFRHLLNFQLNTTAGGITWTITSNCGGGAGSCGRSEPTWEDAGTFSGRCYLSCHERDNSADRRVNHNPFTY